MKTDVREKNNVEVGLSTMVEHKLQAYFKALNGDQPLKGLYDHILREVEKPLIQLALEQSGGNKVKAAKFLGINRNTLYKKIQDLGLSGLELQNSK